MAFLHLETYHIIPALIGGFILFFGLISLVVKEKLFLSEALVAFLFGIAVGPVALGWFNPLIWENHETVTLEFARIIIAVQVMAAGVSLPKKYMWTEVKSLSVLLLPVMFAMWLVTGGIIYAFLPITFLESLLISACVTPTDPVLANSIVKGRFAEMHVPIHVRDILSAESGANDGLGFPYLFFAIFLMVYNSTGEAIGYWFGLIWGYQIALSCVVGALVGYVARKVLRYCEDRELIDKESFLAFWIALALFLMGSMAIIGSDDLLSCFVAGNSFTWDDWFRLETKETHLQEVVDMIFNYSFFIYLGTIIPWSSFYNPSLELEVWKLVVIAILVIFLRRIPALLACKPFIPALHTWREALFAGWFGPIGVGAIFYAMVAIDELESYHDRNFKVTPYIFPTVTFLVLTSIVVHGITIPLFYIGKTIRTRSIATSAAVNNLVSRLPTLLPGQEITIRSARRSNGPSANPSRTVSRVPSQTNLAKKEDVDQVFSEPLNSTINPNLNETATDIEAGIRVDSVTSSPKTVVSRGSQDLEVIITEHGQVVSDEVVRSNSTHRSHS